MVEDVEPFKLHSTSMSYIYKVFEHHQLLWMSGMAAPSHCHHHRQSPDLGELGGC